MTDNRAQSLSWRMSTVGVVLGSCLLAGAAAIAWAGMREPVSAPPEAKTAPLVPPGIDQAQERAQLDAQRVSGVDEIPADEQDDSAADEPLEINALPSDLKKQVEDAIWACRSACKKLNAPFPVWTVPRITLANARKLVEREAQLKRQILESALMEHEMLEDRLEQDPSIGITLPSTENKSLDKLLAEKYPGWPDGYRYIRENDGVTVRVAAWKVADDPVLEALVRDHDALAGEYAATIRSQYLQYLSL